MSTHVYISQPNVYIQKILAHWPVPHNGTKHRLTSLNKKWYTKYIIQIRGPLGHPPLPLPQEVVVDHLYPPQAVVVEHLRDHLAQVAGIHWSSPRAQLLAA